MNAVLGIDLGSAVCKAILLDEEGMILGRGVADTRTDYLTAIEAAIAEAMADATLSLMGRRGGLTEEEMERCRLSFRLSDYRRKNGALKTCLMKLAAQRVGAAGQTLIEALSDEVSRIVEGEKTARIVAERSGFFRNSLTTLYREACTALFSGDDFDEDDLMGLLDQAFPMMEKEILPLDPAETIISMLPYEKRYLGEKIKKTRLEVKAQAATGYGRQLLPFPKELIRSEILCHGKGAHYLFPGTRTVLDIGGQDTKAIQVDEKGVVLSFAMNDRCAAGCGRYLGYVADELAIPLSGLGSAACKACRYTPIVSTCTVFTGIEMRSLLYTGEKKEEVLLGLHRAVVLRALSLLARAGGVRNELTFTGGVAGNEAIVRILVELIARHYGSISINTHSDSIFMGAIGAALYALEGL